MKNLITLLLLAVSAMAFGQTKSQKEEIKYWKSIADSNDAVAYREYLNRFGEDGLYKDEAITKIAILRISGKQTKSKSVECCFYKQNYTNCIVLRFDSTQGKVWLKPTEYDTIRYNLALSRDFYENQETIAKSCGSNNLMAQVTSSSISGKITDSNRLALAGATVVATHTPSGVQYGSVADANGNYRLLNIRPGGPYTIEYHMVGFKTVIQKGVTVTKGETKILNALMNKKIGKVSIVTDTISPEPKDNKYARTNEEYEYAPMKSTSARDVYFRRDKLHQIDYFIAQPRSTLLNDYPDHSFYVFSDDERNDEYYDFKDVIVNKRYVGQYKKVKTMQGYRYVAISKDKSSIIMWFEDDDNLDGKIYEKRNYSRIAKEDLLPKAVNYDFLNE